MLDDREQRRLDAIDEFRRARRRALIEDLLAWLRGQPDDLLDFEEVRQHIGDLGWSTAGLREIPLTAIVGSVGRYHDFTRHFLPRQASDEARWAAVRAAMAEGHQLPPIEVYELGGLYFVKDGNHRVSVARELGFSHLPALITEVCTRISLDRDATLDDVIIATEYAALMAATGLDTAHPDLNLRVTAPGAHRAIGALIAQEQRRLERRQEAAVTLAEAACVWYDQVYLPGVELIRQRGLLTEFPERTETDLYVWVVRRQAALEQSLGWPVTPQVAVAELAREGRRRAGWGLNHARERLVAALVPTTMRGGPEAGVWRRDHLPAAADAAHQGLFRSILVPLAGTPESWEALEQALVVAQRDGSWLSGLHVVTSEGPAPVDPDLSEHFAERCAAAGVRGSLVYEEGSIGSQICERARWADLVVVRVVYPPPPRPLARLRSGLRDLIQRCPQPILAVPGPISPLSRALVAYDGGPRAHEALILAGYLALRGDLSLVVIAADEHNQRLGEILERAHNYLEERGIVAGYVIDRRPTGAAILAAAAEHGSNLIMMGCYGARPAFEIVLGSTLDYVLRESRLPVLICR
ncbi:MAG: universal stress protein [Candidatus Viridilinea halotolerans]|uniref:Universal stress protein n=1 Tax=Candidatus Viridilinea halotolerans TaxID=2491704 RepID=A0A426TRU5_9CHLR|nr:MAG: universal stress protein [Candidatus Viridilinea halotolerans]